MGKMGISGDVGRLSADVGTDFGRFFCKSTQVKSFVDRCHRWSVGQWSPVDRKKIGRNFEDFFIMISAEGRTIIRRQSADDRQAVGRCHFIKEQSADRRRISSVMRPMIARLVADHTLWFVFYILFTIYLQCIHINYEIYHAFILFWDSFHLTSCTRNIWFLCLISNWTLWRFDIIISTSSKRLQPNSGHSLIYMMIAT